MVIYEFKKNALEIIRIEITEYNSERYLNARIWFDAGKGSALEYKPSHKGLTIKLDLITELKKGIDAAFKYYKENDSEKSMIDNYQYRR